MRLSAPAVYPCAGVFAAAEDTLCEHHPEHTADCGYEEGVSECTYHCDICLGHSHEEEQTSQTGSDVISDQSAESDVIADQSADWCGNPMCSQEDYAHVTTCPAYVAPENPECFCGEKCGVETQNLWCDVCGFDYTGCTGGADQAAAYHDGNLEYHAAKQPIDCVTPGNIEYWYCPDCDGYFADANAEVSINPGDIEVTVDCKRPEGAADCATLTCEICGQEIYDDGEQMW